MFDGVAPRVAPIVENLAPQDMAADAPFMMPSLLATPVACQNLIRANSLVVLEAKRQLPFMLIPTRGAIPATASEPRTRSELILEGIALRMCGELLIFAESAIRHTQVMRRAVSSAPRFQAHVCAPFDGVP